METEGFKSPAPSVAENGLRHRKPVETSSDFEMGSSEAKTSTDTTKGNAEVTWGKTATGQGE